ncbi:PBSX family phage terminase large subunit [Lachnospiraceae bacterium NSJ-143]|nr:PBSX family phage terminase large subunit [Lachnospiraceae bacterium NSJ-143]
MPRLSELIAPSFYEAHRDIDEGRYTHYWFKGGRGSCKSSFISIEIILGIMRDKNANAIVLRKVHNSIRDSVFEQMLWAVEAVGADSLWEKKLSAPYTLVLKNTGQKVIFKGCDDPGKIKSTKFKKGYAKYIWFEEADEFSSMEEIRNINQSLLRGGERFCVFYSYNPPQSTANWINRESVKRREGKKTYSSTYKTVPTNWLGEQFFIEADYLRRTDKRAYEHEYLGKATGTGAEVFQNIELREITDEEINCFDKISRGLDWGYATDPLHYTVNYYDKTRRKLYIFYEIHMTGLSNIKAGEMIKKENKRNGTVICDSAEPKSIAELNYFGINAIGAKKGPGSIEYGIKWLQNMEKIVIDPERCPYTAKEFTEYELERDNGGNLRAHFPDKNNHAIDAVRYSRQFDMSMVKVR